MDRTDIIQGIVLVVIAFILLILPAMWITNVYKKSGIEEYTIAGIKNGYYFKVSDLRSSTFGFTNFVLEVKNVDTGKEVILLPFEDNICCKIDGNKINVIVMGDIHNTLQVYDLITGKLFSEEPFSAFDSGKEIIAVLVMITALCIMIAGFRKLGA